MGGANGGRVMLFAASTFTTAADPPTLRLGLERRIAVRRPGFLERETNKFTAALDTGPVIKLVGHDNGSI